RPVRHLGPTRYVAAPPLARQEAGSQPAGRSGETLDPPLVPRPGIASAQWHHFLPEGGVTMSRRPSVSRMRENRTYGLKGGWGTRTAQRHLHPCLPMGRGRLRCTSQLLLLQLAVVAAVVLVGFGLFAGM